MFQNDFQIANPRTVATETPVAIDPAQLERLLALGDATTAMALLLQLEDDFRRLHDALITNSDGSDFPVIAAQSHELKGLASTVGAGQVARLAQLVHDAAEAFNQAQTLCFLPPLQDALIAAAAELRQRRAMIGTQ
jgi:HPt (histidine-containing phosphotransfer) domain-containing protein